MGRCQGAPAKGPRPRPPPAARLEEQPPAGCAAPGAGNGPGGRPRRGPAPPRCREGSRPAAGGVGEGRPGLRPVGGEFSPGLACGSPPGPRPRGPRRRRETHRKGPDPHLGVLPAARAFAQIRHGARPLPGGGFGSHSEAPVSHLRRAGRRGATLRAAARPPGWAEELAGPWAAAAGAAAARAPAARARLRGGCAGAAAPRGPPHARLGSLYRAPPRWRRRRRRTNISLRRPNVLLLLLLLRLSETRSGPEGGGGRREGGEPESREIGGRGVGGREGEAGGRGGDAQISREEGERAAPSGAGRSLGAGGVNGRGGRGRGLREVGGTSRTGRWGKGRG